MANGTPAHRRFREILHYLSEFSENSQVDQNEYDAPLMIQSGILECLGDGKDLNDLLETCGPLYEIPNESRHPSGFYNAQRFEERDEEKMHEDQLIDDGFEFDEEDYLDEAHVEGMYVDVEFSDPYADYPAWGGENESRGRQWLPEHYPVLSADEEEVAWSTYEHSNQREGMEALAWYVPMNSDLGDWGIYIRRGAAAYIAERYLSELPTRLDAWDLALRVLLLHEYVHFQSQVMCDSNTFFRPVEAQYFDYLDEWMRQPLNGYEEAAANAIALHKSEAKKVEKRGIKTWFDTQPEPYNMYHLFEGSKGNKVAIAVIALMQQDFKKGWITATTDRIREDISAKQTGFKKPPFPARVYFVNDHLPTDKNPHPSLHVPKAVDFSRVSIHRDVIKRIKRNRFPKHVVKKLYNFRNKIQGKMFDRFEEHGFVRTKNKTHWRFELPAAHRGIMTQVRGQNGWEIVFVGSHSQYDAYSDAKGLRC